MARSEKEILKDIELADLHLKENRANVKRIQRELLDAETVLIDNKLYREKLQEELRRLRANRQDG